MASRARVVHALSASLALAVVGLSAVVVPRGASLAQLPTDALKKSQDLAPPPIAADVLSPDLPGPVLSPAPPGLPDPGLSPAPPTLQASSPPPPADPERVAEAFVARTKQEAATAVEALTKEAESLRARLRKVESGLRRYQATLQALNGQAFPPSGFSDIIAVPIAEEVGVAPPIEPRSSRVESIDAAPTGGSRPR